MEPRTNGIAPTVLSLVLMGGLNGCSKTEPAATPRTDTPDTVMIKSGENAQPAAKGTSDRKSEAHARHHHKKNGHERHAHARHDHKSHGHVKGKHKHRKPASRHGSGAAPQGSVKVGDKPPDFIVTGLDGKRVKLSELQKDKSRTTTGIVVLSFWCTTCHSCRDVERLLAKLSKNYRGRAAVVALAANADETAESVAAFLKKHGLALPVVLDRSGRTADLFGVQRTTTTVVIDGDGVLRYCGQFLQKAGGSAEAALKAVLAGTEVAVKTTPHFG